MLKNLFKTFKSYKTSFLKDILDNNITIEKLNKYLELENFDINYINENKDSYLHICIKKNKDKVAKWLIKNKINVNKKNNKNKTPLDLIIEKENKFLLEYLIKNSDIDINVLDNDNRSILQNVIIQGQTKVFDVLIKYINNINNIDKNERNILFDAISYGDKEIIDKVLNLDGLELNQIDKHGETVLHKKEILKDMDLCKKLISKGADPTICDFDGKNLLCNLALLGDEGIEMIDFAIEKGHSLNTTVNNDNTLLMETLSLFYEIPTSEKNRRESLLNMASNLVTKGIDVNALNEYGENVLFEAVRNNNYESCLFLIENNININKQNRLKQTPLLLACYKGIEALDIILLLLKNGADPRIRNELKQDLLEILNHLILHTRNNKILKDGFILMYLNKNGQYMLVLKEVLKNSKFKLINQLDSTNQPHFFNPILFNNYELFKLYMINGFDVNQTNKKGLNIFYIYIDFVFKINRYFKEFKTMLILLIQEKIYINNKDQEGKIIFSKVIKNNTNKDLFIDLITICKFKYNQQDLQGRTIMHYAVLNNNLEILKELTKKEEEVLNINDNYGILPITYALLMGYYDIVIYLLTKTTTYIKSDNGIKEIVKIKFKEKLKQIDNIKTNIINEDIKRKVDMLINQTNSDFKL